MLFRSVLLSLANVFSEVRVCVVSVCVCWRIVMCVCVCVCVCVCDSVGRVRCSDG